MLCLDQMSYPCFTYGTEEAILSSISTTHSKHFSTTNSLRSPITHHKWLCGARLWENRRVGISTYTTPDLGRQSNHWHIVVSSIPNRIDISLFTDKRGPKNFNSSSSNLSTTFLNLHHCYSTKPISVLVGIARPSSIDDSVTLHTSSLYRNHVLHQLCIFQYVYIEAAIETCATQHGVCVESHTPCAMYYATLPQKAVFDHPQYEILGIHFSKKRERQL